MQGHEVTIWEARGMQRPLTPDRGAPRTRQIDAIVLHLHHTALFNSDLLVD